MSNNHPFGGDPNGNGSGNVTESSGSLYPSTSMFPFSQVPSGTKAIPSPQRISRDTLSSTSTGMAPMASSMHPYGATASSPLNLMGRNFSNSPMSPAPLGMGFPVQSKRSSTSPSLDASTASSQQQRVSGNAPLRRGQACQSCRRRKLKCDAARPVCGTCEKSRRAAAISNHASPIPDGDCLYDDGPVTDAQTAAIVSTPTESPLQKKRKTSNNDSTMLERRYSTDVGEISDAETPLQPVDARVAQLQATVADLESKLRRATSMHQYHYETGTTPKKWQSRASSREPGDASSDSFRPVVPILSMLSPLSGREEKHRMRYFQRPARYDGTPFNLTSTSNSTSKGVALNTSYPVETEKQTSPADIPSIDLQTVPLADEAFMQLLWPGWSSDLPSAETVTALCETFFRSHPLRTLVYKPSFMSGLLLPPRHPHRPHDSLIHAILCAAADLSPYYATSMPGTRGIRDQFVELLADPFSRPNSQQPKSSEMLTFKEFHLSKARQKVERSLITDFRNPLDWIAASVICCFVLWNDGRFVESYFLSGFMGRACAPAGLDKLPSRHHNPSSKNKPTPGIFSDPQGIEEHERRVVFWHAFIADQYTSGPPNFYENILNEQAVSTNLPCKMSDFFAGNDVAPNPQRLTSTDLFTNGHLDDFTLHIKSVVLLRRAATLICRSQSSRSKPPGVPIVDKHIDEFLSSMPVNTPLHEASTDGLNAYANISLALMYLHEPFLSTKTLCTIREEGSPAMSHSNARIFLATENILKVLHQLLNSSLDFALLHPQMFLTWSVCARMMGKDLMILQQRQQHDQQHANLHPTVSDLPAVLQRIFENLDLIIAALRRGSAKSIKARRCAELVSSVRSGHIHESYLAHLLYLDGVIPVDELDPHSAAVGGNGNNSNNNNGDVSALNQTLMSMTSHSHQRSNDLDGLSANPTDALDQFIPQVFTSPELGISSHTNGGDPAHHNGAGGSSSGIGRGEVGHQDQDDTGDLLNFASI